jgi:YidC/Oxa1 family membrane protein insertase
VDQRRYIAFLVLTLLLWTGYIVLRVYVFPPEKPAAQVNVPAADPAVVDPAVEGDPAAAEPPGGKPVEVKPQPASSRKWYAIGSLDPASPYKMLVTFDSQGAAVARVELNNYWDVESTTGYFGHLALSENPGGGAVVNVVGPGTPAAKATPDNASVGVGLKPGDVITELEKTAVGSFADFEMSLAKLTLPKQKVHLTVQRKGIAQPIVFTADMTRQPLAVVKPESHSYKTPEGGVRIEPTDPLSLLLTLDTVGPRSVRQGASEIGGLPSLLASNWELDESGENFAQFSYTLDEAAMKAINRTGPLKLVKRYELAKSEKPDDKAYHLKLSIEIHNLGPEQETVSYRLGGPTGLPLEGWWYSTKLHPDMFRGAGARDVVAKMKTSKHRLIGCPLIVSEAKSLITENELPRISLLDGDEAAEFEYAGVDTQFYAAAILPRVDAKQEPLKFRRVEALPVQDVTVIPKTSIRTADVSVQLVSDNVRIPPNESIEHEYEVFFGPKDPKILEQYGLEAWIEMGWPIFKYPAQGLQWILGQLYSLTRNYGIAIILLTVIVRSLMVPLSLRQAKSAAMMQQLAPEIQKVKDRYPDDALKQHNEVQALYKKHNFNPFGGCLLVFIQLPIFIGLYRCLSVDIELRDAPLFPGWAWASNLAGPDKLFYWKDFTWDIISHEADGWFGPYFNVFPLITVALFLVQQKLFTPPATDEQTKLQQQMMTYMTVFMGIMFYKVPAGLCLYFITSSLWGICERKLLPKPKPKDAGSETSASAKPPAKPTSANGSSKPASGKKKSRR